MLLTTLCYLKRDGQTLMLHRSKRKGDIHEGKWNGLGGKMEPGESPEECVLREVREESGLRLRDPRLRGVLTFPGFDGEQDWYVFLFTGTDFEGELKESGEGFLKWVPDDEVPRLPLWEGDKYFLGWLEQPYFFSGKFIYKTGKLENHSVVFYNSSGVIARTKTIS
jgi:8-oxo-dGTP diphosphatase